jgi:hypothetical protein
MVAQAVRLKMWSASCPIRLVEDVTTTPLVQRCKTCGASIRAPDRLSPASCLAMPVLARHMKCVFKSALVREPFTAATLHRRQTFQGVEPHSPCANPSC